MATMSVQKRYNSSCVTMRLTPFFTFSEEKAAQEVPSAVFGYPFQAFRPRLFYQVSTKCASSKSAFDAVFSVPEADFLQPRVAIVAGGVYNGEKSGGVRPLEGSDP